ncbi:MULTISPECIES: ATP-binding cassette domain-containing protein [unclassified Herbaspirillum]|uniref:ATP-binding cassette domain-containing protein n=1 Tax=unclassified Herbaspirillum TaxID=2624150 RepID=UPI00160A971C|nr:MULTISPECIES: ATP-binding cassette domain-containing protein [unclassified Herbaspirillum]
MQINLAENSQIQQTSSAHANGVRVVVQGLSKTYGQRDVLKSVGLTVEPGEFVAIVGRSGCGKSTLLRLIAKLEHASAGELLFTEAGIATTEPQTRIMFQDSRLLPWKRVLQNVALGLPKTALGKAAQTLSQVGLSERANEWPAVLSGGQRQRVALARALVHEPELLLLDEPLGALDALTRIEMQQLIESLWQARGFTAVLVTHDVQEAIALADRVVLIEDGKITLDQTINLPRPRARGNPEFAHLEASILARVLQQPAIALDSTLGDISLQKTVGQVQWAV